MIYPKFEEKYTVTSHMTDENGICRAGDTARFLQEAAGRQLEVCGPDAKTLAARGQAFILLRISYDFLLPLTMYERVTAATWPCPMKKGFIHERNYTLTCERNGEAVIAARAVSQWAVWNTGSHAPLHTDALGEFYSHDEPVSAELPLRFAVPRGLAFAEAGEKTVRYTDLDRNVHMNNTRYIDLFSDFLPRGERMRSLSVCYHREAVYGEHLSVLRAEENGRIYFRTVRASDGEVNAEAVCKTV